MRKLIYVWLVLVLFSCKTEDREKVIFVGDSMVERWDLDYYLPGIRQENKGVGGSKIQDVRERLENLPKAPYGVVWVGINDVLAHRFEESMDTAVLHAEIEGLMLELRDHFENCLILEVMVPDEDFDVGKEELVRAHVKTVNQALRAEVVKYSSFQTIILTPMIFGRGYSLDGIHLSEESYFQLSQNIRPYLP